VRENGEAFAAKYGARAVYTDYPAMLRKEKLDIRQHLRVAAPARADRDRDGRRRG